MKRLGVRTKPSRILFIIRFPGKGGICHGHVLDRPPLVQQVMHLLEVYAIRLETGEFRQVELARVWHDE